MNRTISQARRSNTVERIKFDFQVPRTSQEALKLDKENNNTLWADSMKLELDQLMEYQTFEDLGFAEPADHQLIPCHLIFDVKQSGKQKSRFVAGGHKKHPPKESVYSSVVSLRSLRIVCFLAELNNLTLMVADVGNAYLKAHTKEKVMFRG